MDYGTNERTDGRWDRGTDSGTEGRRNESMNRRSDGKKDERTSGLPNKRTNVWLNSYYNERKGN